MNFYSFSTLAEGLAFLRNQDASANLHDEWSTLNERIKILTAEEKELVRVPGDGNCMLHAFCRSSQTFDTPLTARRNAAGWLKTHREETVKVRGWRKTSPASAWPSPLASSSPLPSVFNRPLPPPPPPYPANQQLQLFPLSSWETLSLADLGLFLWWALARLSRTSAHSIDHKLLLPPCLPSFLSPLLLPRSPPPPPPYFSLCSHGSPPVPSHLQGCDSQVCELVDIGPHPNWEAYCDFLEEPSQGAGDVER